MLAKGIIKCIIYNYSLVIDFGESRLIDED